MQKGPIGAAPRVASTIVLVRDDPFEVLTVRRHATATFANAIVFPGGVVDADDHDDEWMPLLTGADDLEPGERAVRIAGIRETFEETGLLLARRPDGTDVAQPDRPLATFRETVAESGGLLALGDIHPFGHWITPTRQPKRFDTRFLLARAPRNQTPLADGTETVGIEWASPEALIERARQGEQDIMFPTYANLLRLRESPDSTDAIRAAATRPPFAVHPTSRRLADGSLVGVIPAEAGYGITEFRL